MSKARERAYERRRYEEWQQNLTTRKRKRRRTQQIVAAVVSSLAALAIIVGVTLLVTTGGDDDADVAASPSTPASSASSPASSPSASASAATVAGGCKPSTLGTIASPKQTSKVPAKSIAAGKKFTIAMKTTCGAITIELDGKKAPQAVASTVTLVKAGFYDKTPCHRLVTSGIYVLQCGDPTGSGSGGPGYSYGPLENVPKDYVYPAGSIAMARGGTADSQGSQFFIVYQKSTIGDAQNGGYTMIGRITKGLDVVTKVAKAGDDESFASSAGGGAPNTPISIVSAKVSEG